VNIKGALIQNTEPAPSAKDFAIQNSSAGFNAIITNPDGNMVLKNLLNQNQPSPLSPTLKSFIIQNKTGQVVAYFNSTGGLYTTGTVTQYVQFG